jgi:serine/threonine-protein phosphatase PPG1
MRQCWRSFSNGNLHIRIPEAERVLPQRLDAAQTCPASHVCSYSKELPLLLCFACTDEILASVDLDECISRLYKKELLAESVIEAICAKTKELLMQESNVVHVQAPVTVVGDIHGQFYDLIEIFRIGGYCPDTNYLFLGMPFHSSDNQTSSLNPAASLPPCPRLTAPY